MKNKKKLLIAVAAMGLFAVATAGVGTAAWFTASSATPNAVANNNSLDVTTSTYSAGNFYVKAVLSGHTGTIQYTDKSGNEWVIVNGFLQAATSPGTKYKTISVSLGIYSDAGCTEAISGVPALKALGNHTFVMTLTTGTNTRITHLDPSSDFATAFSSKLNANPTNTYTLADGVVSLASADGANNHDTYYVSVNGDGDSEVVGSHSAGEAAASEYTTDGSLNVTIAVDPS